MSELPLLPNYGWSAYQEINTDPPTLSGTQDIVIHRTTGTAYMDIGVGLTTWHIYQRQS